MELGFHGDKNLIKIIDKVVGESEYFVELGTRIGRSLSYLASKFPKKRLRSCEINEEFYEKAVERCEPMGDVRVFNMDSVSFLESFWIHWVTEESPKDSVFWLDTGKGSVLEEITFISSKFEDCARMFVDDVEVPRDNNFTNFNFEIEDVKESVEWDDYVLFFPDYKPNTDEMYHPPTGWCLIVKDREYIKHLKSEYHDILNWYDYGFSPNRKKIDSREKFEFATTACIRPELLEKTYSSFNDCLTDLEMKKDGVLYINIDPVPYQEEERIKEGISEELEVARYYFDQVKYNIGEDEGCFPKAVKWIFDQPKGDYFFHLEDDWVHYGGEIEIEEYIRKMEEDERGRMLQCVTYNNGGGNRVHFPPNMMNNQVLSEILEENPIPEDSNPEQHIKDLKLQHGVEYNVTCDENVDREDIGRSWARSRGISRDFSHNNLREFINWDLSNFNE